VASTATASDGGAKANISVFGVVSFEVVVFVVGEDVAVCSAGTSDSAEGEGGNPLACVFLEGDFAGEILGFAPTVSPVGPNVNPEENSFENF